MYLTQPLHQLQRIFNPSSDVIFAILRVSFEMFIVDDRTAITLHQFTFSSHTLKNTFSVQYLLYIDVLNTFS
jgi:hypothetical protein